MEELYVVKRGVLLLYWSFHEVLAVFATETMPLFIERVQEPEAVADHPAFAFVVEGLTYLLAALLKIVQEDASPVIVQMMDESSGVTVESVTVTSVQEKYPSVSPEQVLFIAVSAVSPKMT